MITSKIQQLLAWELLTDIYKLDPKKLIVTVYDDDEETYKIWRSKIGISRSRILKIGDNKEVATQVTISGKWRIQDLVVLAQRDFDYGPNVKGDLQELQMRGIDL